MSTTKKINTLYIASVFSASIAVLALITLNSNVFPIWEIIVLSAFAAIAESLSVNIGERTLSVSSAITLCGLIAYGPIAAVWISFISVLLRIKKHPETQVFKHLFNTKPTTTIYNSGMCILSGAGSSLIYLFIGGQVLTSVISSTNNDISTVFSLISKQAVFILVAIFVDILINTLLFAGYLHTTGRGQLIQEWLFDFFWSFAGLLVVGLMGVLMTAFYLSYGWFIMMLFFAPLFLARYTFSLYSNLRVSYMDTVKSLSDAIEAKDLYTRGHSQRVQEYSQLIADELKYTPKQKEVLLYAALLHDVGKIGVTEFILNKPGKLDCEEFDSIKQHPVLGAKIISNVKYLKECVPIIKYHHKYYDGSGYPETTPDDKVPFESYILCVADAYDAMTSLRVYRDPFTHERALEEIVRCSGTQFDPTAAKAFLKAMEKQQPVAVVLAESLLEPVKQ